MTTFGDTCAVCFHCIAYSAFCLTSLCGVPCKIPLIKENEEDERMRNTELGLWNQGQEREERPSEGRQSQPQPDRRNINEDIKRHILEAGAPENSARVTQKQPKVPPSRESKTEPSRNIEDRKDSKDEGRKEEGLDTEN